jgi:hypothetical protein
MSLVISDRVKETSITTGTGTVSLGGTFGAFQSFGSSVGDGNQTYYGIENESRWEVGLGTYSASGNTLSRDTVFGSSLGAGSGINLNGVSIVFCTYPASKAVFLNADGALDVPAKSIIQLGSGNVIVSNDMYITGNTTISGIFNASGDVVFNKDLSLAGDMSIAGNIGVSGTAEINNSATFNSDVTIHETASVNNLDINGGINNVQISGNLNLTPYNKKVTTFKLSEPGNIFHAYVDSVYDRTVSLHNDGEISPTWKLGLKSSPDDTSEAPDHAYVHGKDGDVRLVANSTSSLRLSHPDGFVVQHQNDNIIKAHAVTGVHIDSSANSYPALTVDGGSSHTASIQEWANDGGTVLSLVDKNGNLHLGQTSSPSKLNVYNKFITASSYERLSVYGRLSSNFIIAAEADGIGAVRDIEFPTAVQFTGDVVVDKTTEDAGLINFRASADADATSAISTLTNTGATTHHIQVEINGVKAWIACSTNNPA